MANDQFAIEVGANVTGMGRIQRDVLKALRASNKLTTAQLSAAIYGRAGEFEQHSIVRAIRALIRRGFSVSSKRKGRVNATGYVYEWSLQ